MIDYFFRNFNYNLTRSIGCVLIFLCCSTNSIAQRFPFDYWYDGTVVTEAGDTLKGKIKYDPQNDLIQLGIGSRYESFTARKVIYYELRDAASITLRRFYALPYEIGRAHV